MIHIEMHVHSRTFDDKAEEKFRLALRRVMTGFIFDEFDKLAKQEGWSFDHTSLEISGSIKSL